MTEAIFQNFFSFMKLSIAKLTSFLDVFIPLFEDLSPDRPTWRFIK